MAGRKSRRLVDGVILLNKPPGLSSQQAVSRVRGLFNAAKAGHTGTLDPAADGLLPVCLGEATKFTQLLLDADKSYRARLVLGVTTTTGDAEGEVLARKPPITDRVRVEEVVARFHGNISQIPPMYSALKHQGKPLYEFARAGVELHREARNISIHEIQVIVFEENYFDMQVRCSKGTYIRTLAVDIGEALGCGASLRALTRTGIGDFTLDDARVQTLPGLEALTLEARDVCLLPVDLLAGNLPELALDEALAARVMSGQRLPNGTAPVAGLVRLYGPHRRFLGMAEVDGEGRVAPRRLLSTEATGAA